MHIEETDSFGRRLSHHKLANVAMLSFGGGQLDEDTGLVHFLFRDYYPTTGFFIQQDPLGLRGGDVDVYGYCLDDPVNLIDPLGLRGIFHKLTPEERKYIHNEASDMTSTMLELGRLLTDLPSYAGLGAEAIKAIMQKDSSSADEVSRSIQESRAPADHSGDSLHVN